MDKKYGGSFKKPRSLLGRRSQRFSLSGNNDSRLEPISESATPTPSTSRQDTTLTADESLPLGYDSLCDETMRTPLSHKYSSQDFFKTPTYTSNLRMPMGLTDSHKKVSRFTRPERAAQKSVSLQTSRELDIMGTPPHVLRRRLDITSSAFTDLEEEYKHLQKFTTLEKQVLSVEGLTEMQNENTKLKVDAYHLLEEAKILREKITFLENNSSVTELQSEIESLKKQFQIATDEASSLREKLQGVTTIEINMIELQSENEFLKDQVKTLTDEAASLREKLQEVLPENGSQNNIADLEAEVALLKEQVHSLTDEATSLKGKLQEFTSENEKLKSKLELTDHKLIDLEMVSEAKETKWCRREEELTKSLQEAWTLLENYGVKKDSINSFDKPFTCDVEKYNLVQDTLNDKIKMLNSLQLEIASTQSSFVSAIDDKNLRITSLVEIAKTKFEQVNKGSEKIKTLEELLHCKESDLTDLKSQLDSIKQNASNHISHIYNILSDNKFSDLIHFDEDLLVDLKQLHDKYSSDNITVDKVLEGVNLKITSLANALINIKKQKPEEDKNLNNLLQEHEEKINHLSEELNMANSRIKNFVLEIKEKDEKLNDIQTELQEKEINVISLSDKLTDCRGKLDSITEELSKRTQTLDRVLPVFEKLAVVASLFSPDPILVNESNFEEILNLMKVKYLEFFDLIEHLRNAIDSRDDKMSILAHDILSEQLSNEELKSLISKHNQELKVAKSDVETHARDLQLKDEVINKLTNECNSYEAKRQEYESIIKTLELKLSEVDSTDETKNEVIKELKEKLDLCKCDVMINEKELHIDTIRKYLSSLDNEMLPAHHDVIINSYDDIILGLKSKFSSFNDYNEQLKNEILSKKDQLKEITECYDALKEEMSKADDKTKELVQKLEMCHCALILNEQKSFFKTISDFLSSIDSDNDLCPINNYDDLIHCLSNKFSSNNDLNEHLRNKIESKEDQLREVTSSCDIMKEQILKADTKIKELQEKLDSCQCSFLISEQQSFFSTAKECLSCIDSDVYTINDYSDIISCIETKFSSKNDLNEHLRNKIESKEDQLREVTNSCDVMKEQIVTADSKIKELQEKLDSCQCSFLISEQQSFFSTAKECLSCIDSDVYTINNYSDIISCIETKFSSNFDLNEHLRNKIESKDNKLKEMTNICNIMKKQIASSEAKNEELKNAIKSKEEQLQVIVDICNTVKNELKNSFNELSDLENNLITTASELSSLNQREEEKNTMIGDLIENVNELNSELERCSHNFSHYKNSVGSQMSEIIDLKEHLENKLQSKKDIIFKITQEFKQIKSKCMSAEENNVLELSFKNSEIGRLKDQIAQLEQELEAKDKKCVCDLVIYEKQTFFDSLSDYLSTFDRDVSPIHHYNEVIRCLQNKFSSLNDLNEHLKNKVKSKEDQLEDVSRSFAVLKNKLEDSREEICQLISKFQDSEKQVNLLKQKAEEDNILIEELKETIINLNCKLSLCSDDFSSYKQNVESKLSELEALKEYSDNKMLSNSDQIVKMSPEHQYFKETNLLHENRFSETESMKITETENLKVLEETLDSKNCESRGVCDSNENVSISKSLELNISETVTRSGNKNEATKLKEKLEIGCCDLIMNEQQSFFNTINNVFSSFDTDVHSISNFDDIVNILNNKFSSNYDLIELLRDKIESKEDQLKDITNSFGIMKEQLVDAENKHKDLQQRLDYCCSQASNEQHLFFTEIKDHLSSIDCCHCPINKYEDVINCLKNKIAYINDLNDHLKNKVNSKEDQLNKILLSFNSQKNKLEDSRKEVSELEFQLRKTEDELFLLRQSQNEDKEMGIKQVQDEIRQLNSELKVSLDSFSQYKKNMILKMSELEDIKEHLDNKLQSKSDQILKITQELKLFKEKGLSKEKKFMDEMSFKDCEIQSLKTSEKQLTECISYLKNKISQLEEDLEFRNNETQNVINDIEYKSKIRVLELNLREATATIESKNEVVKELLEKLDVCRCEVIIKEQQSFFNSIRDCLSSIDTDLHQINKHDDIISVLTNKLSSINDLNEHLRNKIESKEDQLKENSITCDNMKKQITTADEKIKELQEKLDKCSCNVMINELHSFMDTLRDYLSSIDSEMSPLDTYSDIVSYLKIKFSANLDLNEHLRNKIKSKEEKLEEIFNSFNVLKIEHDETCKELIELQTKQFSSEKELCLVKQREEEKESLVEQLLEQIKQLNSKLELSSENFSRFEQNIGSKISELEDLKEHLENKLQSKSEQLLRVSQEYKLLKETGLSNENNFAEELSLKNTEIEVLRDSEKHLFERINNLESQIIKLEEEIDLKNNECKNVINKLECLSSLLEEKNKSNLNENISSLEKQLSEAFKELDSYKTNEVNKDNDIVKLELQVCELNSSLASKTKEIHNYNENMDRLSQNIVELIQDKESFFDKLKVHISFSNFKNFDDVLEIVKSSHSELMDLKEYVSNNLRSNDEHGSQLETLKNEYNSLKKEYESAILEFDKYRAENPCELVSSLRECDEIISDILTVLSSNQPEIDLSSLCTKGKIKKINDFINELLFKIRCLEKELENQILNNSVNKDFVEQINSDIFTRIESTNQVINDLCLDVSLYKLQFDERIALKDTEIESLQKEVGLSLMDVKELVTVSEKQNNDILCLTNAYLNLQAEYESMIDNCKSSVKSLYESDNNLLNEYVSISQDLMTTVHELNNSNHLNTLSLLNRDAFLYYETLILNYSELFTEVFDKLCLNITNAVECLKVDHQNLDDECDLTSSVLSDLNSFKLEPRSIVSLVRPHDIGFENIADCEKLFGLIDSISIENKMLDLTHKQLVQENIDIIKNKVDNQQFRHTKHNVPYTIHMRGNADVSLLMSVVDETVVENADSSVISVDKNDTLSESFASLCPEKTQYILPEGRINTSDVQLEKTLYLPNSVGNASSSDVDPLNAIDKTMASGYTNAWLNFDNKFNRNCLDESGAEFHDAHDSAEDVNPFAASIDPVLNVEEENVLTDLKKLLRLQSVDNMELLVEVKAIIASVEAVKTCVQGMYPDIAGEKVDNVVRVLLDKILSLEMDKASLHEKYKVLYMAFGSAQKSVEQLKNIKHLISSDLEKTQMDVLNHTSIISKHLKRSHEIILAQDKDALDIEYLRKDQENLKVLYESCSIKLQSALNSNNDLEKSLQEYKDLLKDSLSKHEELLTEQNCLKMEFEKVKRDYKDAREVAKELKDNLDSKNNETISLNNEIMNLQLNIASSEKHINDTDNKLKQFILENTNLLSEVSSLKDQIESSNDLNVKCEKLSSELSNLEVAYNLLKTNHDDLLNKFLDAQKIVESVDRGEHKSLLNNNDVVEGLQKILRTLDFDDDLDLRDNIVHTLSKIQRRISLLLEHQSDMGAVSSSHEINDLNQKIRSLESDLYDANSFKLSFTKELRSLKPELKVNDLLKRPLNELHTLMITEIMSRENSIISNIKSEYETKIMTLKDELHQFIEKDKRRAEWVSEVESDNEQLNTMTKKLNEDIHSVTERLESKVQCEKYILIELRKLEQKISGGLEEDEPMSSQDIDLDTFKKSEVTGEILVKLQNIVKNFLPSDESSCYNVDKYKESIKMLEFKCLDLQNHVIKLEQHNLDSNKEIIELKNILTDKNESHKKEIDNLNRSMETLKHTLCVVKEKLNFAEERALQEQEQLQREKTFSLKTLKENEHSKKQLEEHIEHLHKMNVELNDAKETIRSTISKHEEEICSLMKVITDLECELKVSRRTEEEKGSIESELFQANKKLINLKQEYSSQINDLENENKTLKNEINIKLKEISFLKDEHEHELKFLKSSLNDNINMNTSLKNTNENFISKISVLESELSEKEAIYRDSVAKLMRERENNMEKIKTLEEFTSGSTTKILELENKLTELDQMCNFLMSDFNKKEINYKERVQEMECLVVELKKKIEVTENILLQKQKAHVIEVNDLNDKINGYLERISQFDKCLSDNKESEKGFISELLKLFPECSSCSTELLSLIKSKLAEITALKEELEDKNSECRYLEEDCDEMIKNVKELQRRIGEVCRAQFEDETKYKSLLEEKDAAIERLQSQVFKQSDVDLNECKRQENIINTLEQNINILKTRLKEAEVSITNLSEENTALRKQISQKPLGCKECKQIMDQVIHFKAKLSVKEVKIAELTSKIMDIESQKKEVSKENDSILKTYMDKIEELEKEKVRLTALVKTEHPSVSPLKDINNQQPLDAQSSKIGKLESRVTKLEKDREFLKRLCEKRATVINELKHELESKKK